MRKRESKMTNIKRRLTLAFGKGGNGRLPWRQASLGEVRRVEDDVLRIKGGMGERGSGV